MRPVEAVRSRVSYADLQRMPEDGHRYELYDGELYVVPSPLPIHQIVAARLHAALLEHARGHGGAALYAPLDIVFSDYDVVQPDVVYFGASKVRRLDPKQVIRIPPDAAFEVLSPSTARNDRGRKREWLARYGVPEYWILDPLGKTIEWSQLTQDEYDEPLVVTEGRCASSIIAGFEIDLAPLFADGFEI
jgi:Uma2 family endonuclease